MKSYFAHSGSQGMMEENLLVFPEEKFSRLFPRKKRFPGQHKPVWIGPQPSVGEVQKKGNFQRGFECLKRCSIWWLPGIPGQGLQFFRGSFSKKLSSDSPPHCLLKKWHPFPFCTTRKSVRVTLPNLRNSSTAQRFPTHKIIHHPRSLN